MAEKYRPRSERGLLDKAANVAGLDDLSLSASGGNRQKLSKFSELFSVTR